MRIEILDCRSADGIARLEAAWRELQQAGGVSHPMYTWEWMSTWWEVFGEERSLLALIASENGRVAAIAPFVRHRARMNRLFSFRRLELMGTGEDERDEVFSEYVDIPSRPGTGREAAERLADEILNADGKGKWEDIVLHRVRPESSAYMALQTCAQRRGMSAKNVSEGKCPYVELPDIIEDYMKQLGKKRRHQTRRSMRDLAKLGKVSFEKADSLDEALATLHMLGQLHQGRWEARGKPGVFSSQRFTQFHRQFIGQTFALGWPQLWTLRLDGEPIACRYNLRYQDRISCYLSGTRILERSRIQTGIVAHYFCIKEAIESGAMEYDFMLGEQAYKLSMSNAARELVTLRISRPCAKETLRKAACSVVGRVRRLRAGVGGRRP